VIGSAPNSQIVTFGTAALPAAGDLITTLDAAGAALAAFLTPPEQAALIESAASLAAFLTVASDLISATDSAADSGFGFPMTASDALAFADDALAGLAYT